MEMVKELEIADWEPLEIAYMIEGEISALVPHWKRWDLSRAEAYHTSNYRDEDNNDDGRTHHPFRSFSSHSSSDGSASVLMRINEIADRRGWLQGMSP